MPEEELVLETEVDDLTPESLDDAIEQSEQEIEDKPEETPAEFIETEEVTEEPAAPPELVTKYNPGIAEVWDTLNEAQRSKVMEDVAARLDASPKEREEVADTTTGERASESDDHKARTSEARQAPSLPPPLSDAHKNALIEFFGDEDSQEGAAIRRLIELPEALIDYFGEAMENVGGALDGLDGQLTSIGQERKLQTALENHADEFGDITQDEFRDIAEKAGEMVSSGKVKRYDDAIDLVMYQSAKEGKSPEQPEVTGKKRRKAQQAKSFANPTRKSAKGTPPRVNSIDDAIEQAQAEL